MVVFGIPLIAVALAIGWMVVKPAVVANTGGKIEAVWSDDGPTYGPGVDADDLDVAEHDPMLQHDIARELAEQDPVLEYEAKREC